MLRCDYCFEQNGLFKRVLTALGFPVKAASPASSWLQEPGSVGRIALKVRFTSNIAAAVVRIVPRRTGAPGEPANLRTGEPGEQANSSRFAAAAGRLPSLHPARNHPAAFPARCDVGAGGIEAVG